MKAEITWNGIAKSYRVKTTEFRQNRTRTVDNDDDLIRYCKSTKGFTVVVDESAPKPIAAKAPEPPADEPEAEDEPKGDDGSPSAQPARTGPRGRGSGRHA